MSLVRWRGLKALVQDAVEHGTRAVETVHLATANRTFVVLEAIEPAVKPIHTVHDLSVSTVYGSIRLVNGALGKVLDVVIDEVERRRGGVTGG